MDRQEHIHIISAGESIHKTYPAVLTELPGITHTFIIAEKEAYTNSVRDDNRKRLWKCAIRDAIDEVYACSLSRHISCALVRIDAATFDAIRDPVLSIFSEHADARYSFDISAGSKRLSLGLFSMALWVGGDTWYAFGHSPIRRVPVPALPARSLPENPHLLVILTILFRGREHQETSTLVPEETLFNEIKAWQVPVSDDGSGVPGQELSRAAFLRMLNTLAGWNLIRKEIATGNVQEHLYRITPDGELALYVYAARMKKRGANHPPGLT
jgi:hypothetical protein